MEVFDKIIDDTGPPQYLYAFYEQISNSEPDRDFRIPIYLYDYEIEDEYVWDISAEYLNKRNCKCVGTAILKIRHDGNKPVLHLGVVSLEEDLPPTVQPLLVMKVKRVCVTTPFSIA